MIQKVPWNHLQETGVRSITHPDQPYLCVSYAAHIFDFYNSRKYGNLNQSPNLYWPCQDETFCERWIQVVIMESFSHRDFAFMILLIISWLPPGCLCPSVLVVLRALSQHALPVIKSETSSLDSVCGCFLCLTYPPSPVSLSLLAWVSHEELTLVSVSQMI